MNDAALHQLIEERNRFLGYRDVRRARLAAHEIISRSGDPIAALVEQGIAFARADCHSDAARYFLEARNKAPSNEKACWYAAIVYKREADWLNWRKENKNAMECASKLNNRYWNGSEECTDLLVLAAGGIGDIIYNLRFADYLRDKARRKVIIAIPKRLIPFIKYNKIYDEHLPIENLNSIKVPEGIKLVRHEYLAGLASEDELSTGLYHQLKAPVKLNAEWRRRWSQKSGESQTRIGLCWRGKEGSIHHQGRSLTLDDFQAAAQLNSLTLVALQYDATTEELHNSCLAEKFTALQTQVSLNSDFMSLSSQMMNIETILTCDTGIAHLAASLGRRTFVLTKEHASCFWNDDKHLDMYPSTRVFRKKHGEEWSGCAQRALAEL